MPYFGDSFDDDARHPNWTAVQAGATSMEETGGRATFGFSAGNPGVFIYSYYQETVATDYTSGVAQIEMVQFAADGAGGTVFEWWKDNGNSYQFLIEGSAVAPLLLARARVGGTLIVDASLGGYSAATHRFLRLRHDSAAGKVHWETSADGSTWVSRMQSDVAAGAPVGALKVRFGAHAWGHNDSGHTAMFDNFNPAAPTQVNGTSPSANTPPVVVIAEGVGGTLVAGQTQQLTASVTDAEDSPNPSVTWSSSNPQVATVSASGLVTSITAGTATVTAAATDAGGRSGSDTFAVTVTAATSTTHQLRERRISDGAHSPIVTVLRPNN